MVGTDVFRVARVNTIMRALRDEREMPKELSFLGRTYIAPAADSDIMARFTGRVQIADLVADDAKALTYNSGKFTFESTSVPNLKLGVQMDQSTLNELASLSALDIQDEDGIFRQWERRTIDALLLGIRQRQEALIIGMHLNGFNYDRLGIKTGDITWGMPSDLQITVNPAWTDASNATPVDDILELKRLLSVRYGQRVNRMTLSLTAFNYMCKTTQFQNFLKNSGLFGPVPSEAAVMPVANTELMKGLAARILGLEVIEIYDGRYWSQDSAGNITSAPFLPINKVIFTDTSDDNNPDAYDWANGIVTESIVGSLLKGRSNIFGEFNGPTRGPISYAAPTDIQLNPPGITYWGVARGFPRKHRLQSSSVFTVGTFTDDIPLTEPTFS